MKNTNLKDEDKTPQETGDSRNKRNSKKRVSGGTPRNGSKRPGSRDSRDYRDNMCNDPRWYIPTDQNLKDVATFSFNHPAGYRNGEFTRYTSETVGNFYTNDRSQTIPGIATLTLIPTVGTSSDETSAVNISAMNMYSAIRRANSGAKNYDAPDLMSVVLAVGSVYSCISWLFRLYGYTNVYSSQNAYVPRALIEANGVNAESLMLNQNDFRSRLNQLVLQINAINVPKGLPIFDRWFHIYEKCYADSSTPQAQIYQAAPRGFLHRRDSDGALTYVPLPYYSDNSLMDYESLIIYVNDMINSLLYSEDVGTISGDVLKAFGDSGVYKLPIIPEDYTVVPTLSDEIRSQFENATIIPVNDTYTTYEIIQNNDKAYLVTNLKYIINSEFVAPASSKLLNFHKSDINPEDVIVATRWIPGIIDSTYEEATSQCRVNFSSFGSEIASGLIITTTAISPDNKIVYSKTTVGSGHNLSHYNSDTASTVQNYVLGVLRQTGSFDWFPEVAWFYDSRVPSGSDLVEDIVTFVSAVVDYDRYDVIQRKNIDDLNTTAIFGLFGVPNL